MPLFIDARHFIQNQLGLGLHGLNNLLCFVDGWTVGKCAQRYGFIVRDNRLVVLASEERAQFFRFPGALIHLFREIRIGAANGKEISNQRHQRDNATNNAEDVLLNDFHTSISPSRGEYDLTGGH